MSHRPPRRSGLVAALLAALVAAAASGAGTAAMAQAPAKAAITYTIEQLRTGPLTPEIQQQMVPMHTLAAVEALLKANKIAFAWIIGDVSSDSLPPETASQIAALPPKEVFVAPSANGFVIGVIIGQR
jgi:hypothetical protein